jgi:hypothetical protein
MATAAISLLHVRFAGRSEEFELAELALSPEVGDADLWTALAKRYDCKIENFDGYVIVRDMPAIIVRPVAIYG